MTCVTYGILKNEIKNFTILNQILELLEELLRLFLMIFTKSN